MTEHKPTADLISEIEARWGDRFEELKEPSPPGTTRRGYVVDIYNLLNALKTKIRLPKPSDRLAELEAALERADDLMFRVNQARHADNATGVAYRMVPDHTNHAIDQMEEYLETKEQIKQQALQPKGEA